MSTRADEYFQRARKAERQRNALREENERLREAAKRVLVAADSRSPTSELLAAFVHLRAALSQEGETGEAAE